MHMTICVYHKIQTPERPVRDNLRCMFFWGSADKNTTITRKQLRQFKCTEKYQIPKNI